MDISSDDAVTFLGYNTHLFGNSVPSWLIDFLHKLGLPVPELTYKDTERAKAISQKLSSGAYDLVGLTEVWDDTLANLFETELAGVYPYTFRPPVQTGFPRVLGSGLLILSKYPLADPGGSGATGAFQVYDDLVGLDALSHKGVATTRVSVPASGRSALALVLALSHTQAGSSDDAVAARASNLSQLASVLEGVQGTGPLVLIGDLNVDAEVAGTATQEYDQMLSALSGTGAQDLYRTLFPDATTDPGYTYDAVHNNLIPIFAPQDVTDEVQQRIDYNFQAAGSSDLEGTGSQVITDFTFQDGDVQRDLSDHYPLADTFRL